MKVGTNNSFGKDTNNYTKGELLFVPSFGQVYTDLIKS